MYLNWWWWRQRWRQRSKVGHKLRDTNETNGKRYHKKEEIRKAHESAKLRAGFGSGGGKGAIARSGGAAEGSAPQMFAGMSREEVAYRAAQEKAARGYRSIHELAILES
jgi:hypothetical protein